MPSENMRTTAREWLYSAEYPNECASQQEVDDLATLLDEVRADALRPFEFTGLRGTWPRCTAEDPDRYVDARPHSETCVFAALPVVASPAPPLRPRE